MSGVPLHITSWSTVPRTGTYGPVGFMFEASIHGGRKGGRTEHVNLREVGQPN